MAGPSAPPTYDEATDPDAPPPTYDSLYGRLRSSRDPSSFLSTLHSAWVGCCGTVFALVLLGVLAVLPLAMLLVGAAHLHDCPIQPMIPRYLVVSGCLSIFKTVLDIGFKLKQRRDLGPEADGERRPKGTPIWLESFINIVLFSFFIAGTVWVYQNAWPDFEHKPSLNETGNGNETASRYCDEVTYKLAFATVTMSWVFFALALVCCSGVLGCMCLVLGLSGAGGSVERRSWDDEQTRTVDASRIGEKERYQATLNSQSNPCQTPDDTAINIPPDPENDHQT